MTDSLRTRIAAAIESVRIQRDGDSYKMADAVIAELKLRQIAIPAFGGNPPYTGYVTDWKADDE